MPNTDWPIRIDNAEGTPFADLERSSGALDQDSAVSAIGKASLKVHGDVLKAMILVPDVFRMTDTILEKIQSALRHSGKTEPVLIAGTGGRDLHRGRLGHDGIETINAVDANILGRLSDMDNMLAGLAREQDLKEAAIANCPHGSINLEIGAGMAWDRLRTLDQETRNRGGKLICHDILPDFARAAEQNLPGIPYICTPTDAEYLGKVLRSSAAPIVMTMKNVLSSMSYSSLLDLIHSLVGSPVQKVVATQSLAVAENSNFRPQFNRGTNLRSYFTFTSAQNREYMALLEGANLRGDDLTTAAVYACTLFERHVDLILFNVLTHHFSRLLKEKTTLKNVRTEQTKCETLVDGESYLGEIFPDLLDNFRDGGVNVISFSPFGRTLYKKEGIAEGKIRIESTNIQLIAQRMQGRGKGIQKQQAKSRTTRFITPRELIDTPLDHIAAEGLVTAQSVERIQASGLDIELLKRQVLAMAADLVFKKWGEDEDARQFHQDFPQALQAELIGTIALNF